jgi:nucleotide-binding universal stress UspA family protein
VTPRISEQPNALVRPEARQREISTVVEVVPSESVHTALLQTANRRDVDAICLTTRARTALSQVMRGSNAQEVIRHAHQPVVLVPAGLA